MTKITKSHSTILDNKVANLIVGFLEKNKNVKSFTAGFISPKRPPSRVEGPTKIILTDNSLILNINSKSAKQEVRVFGQDLQNLAKNLQVFLSENNLKFRVGDVV